MQNVSDSQNFAYLLEDEIADAIGVFHFFYRLYICEKEQSSKSREANVYFFRVIHVKDIFYLEKTFIELENENTG